MDCLRLILMLFFLWDIIPSLVLGQGIINSNSPKLSMCGQEGPRVSFFLISCTHLHLKFCCPTLSYLTIEEAL